MIYLDNAATTLQKPPEVALSMARAVRTLASPGRGGHLPASAAAETLFALREEAAALFHVPEPERVILTGNATHALNIALFSLGKPGARVVLSPWEHNAVLRPLHAMGAEKRILNPADELGSLEELLPGADFCVLNHVSNVNGRVLPLREAAALCREKGVPLVVDASQSAGAITLDAAALGAAFLCMPGHKGLYGPQGTGLLLVGGAAKPLLFGGTGSASLLATMPEELPDRLEAGTHNMPGAAGLLEGLRFVRRMGEARIHAHEVALVRRARAGLSAMPGVSIYGAGESGVLSFNVTGREPERLAEELSQRGFALRAGLHCAPLAHKTLGTLPGGTLRLSVSAYTRSADIAAFLTALQSLT